LDPPLNKMRGSRGFRAAVLIVLGLLAAWSWLFVVSRWGPAQRIDILTFKAGLTSKVMRRLLKPAEQTGHNGHDHEAASLSGIYATPEYYALTEQARDAARYQPEQFAVFYLFEDTHIGELPTSPPEVTLAVNEAKPVVAAERTVIRDSPHHRVTVVRFPRRDGYGQPLIGDTATSLDLVAHQPADHSLQAMRWDLPIVYPQDLKEADLSLPMLLALLAGLLAVLSPCLLQLTLYYTFALTGISMHQGTGTLPAPGIRAQVIRSALYFIAGFTVVFTAVGSLAGLAGQKLESSGIIEGWSRPLSIAAGAGILLLGLRVAINSDASGVCRLPFAGIARTESRWVDGLKVMFLGSAFAVGCSTCFGGALFMSLMIYIGTVGSASLGALALFLFSVGIAVPYLLAAFFLSRALPLLRSLQKVASSVGLACSIVMIFFGVILMTDNFHIPSNLLYRLYLGL
jgi:cytochrome c-type biogenesis protein